MWTEKSINDKKKMNWILKVQKLYLVILIRFLLIGNWFWTGTGFSLSNKKIRTTFHNHLTIKTPSLMKKKLNETKLPWYTILIVSFFLLLELIIFMTNKYLCKLSFYFIYYLYSTSNIWYHSNSKKNNGSIPDLIPL